LPNEFGDGYIAPLGNAAAVSLDAFDFVKSLGREVRRAAVKTTDHGDVLDNQQAGALAVTSRQTSDMRSGPTAVLTTDRRFSRVSPHKQ
jgi:hypothetical protein